MNFSYEFGNGLNWGQTRPQTPMIGQDNNAVGFLGQVLSFVPIKDTSCDLPTAPAALIDFYGVPPTGGMA